MIWIWNFLSKVHMQGFGRQPVALLGHGGTLGDESSGRKLGYWGHVLEGIIRTQTPSFSFLPTSSTIDFPRLYWTNTGPK